MSIEYYHDTLQGSDEWHKMRLGMITASRVNTILTSTGKPASNAASRGYAYEIAAQRELMYVEDTFQSFDMVRGTLQEGIARTIYNDNYAPVNECGFIVCNHIGHGAMMGCSPDGLVGDDGGIEIKSRLSKFQMETIVKDEVPGEYMNQVQAFLLVSGRKWCDFVQYSNGMPLYVKRVERDEDRIAAICLAVIAFEMSVRTILDDYRMIAKNLVKTERVDFLADDEITESGEIS